jgi:aspartate racemase
VTAHAVRAAGLQTVGLLATGYTMEQDFHVGRLRDMHDLEVLVPDEADRRIVHDVLVGPADAPIPVFDTTRLHAERAVELAAQ